MFYSKIFKKNIFNLIFVSISALSMIVLYKYTPVYTNVEINKNVQSNDIDNYNMSLIDGSLNIDRIDELIKNNKGNIEKTYMKMVKYIHLTIEKGNFITQQKNSN